MFAISQSASFVVCKDGEDAANKGFVYNKEYKRLKIDKFVVVQRGTQKGNATVDIVLVDEEGNKYVTMTTANLLRTMLTTA